MREFITPLGTDLVAVALPSGHIRGIEIDNPSGSWLRVTGIEQYVPPWTEHWAYPVAPAATSLDVRFTDSPAGSLSSQEGGPVIVRLYEAEIPAATGGPSGAGARQATIPVNQRAILPSSTDVLQTIIVNSNPSGNHRIVVRRLSVVPDLSAGLGTPQPFRSSITLEFASSGGGILICILAISPESPFAEASFEDGVLALNPAASLQVLGRREPETAIGYYLAMAQYYEEVV